MNDAMMTANTNASVDGGAGPALGRSPRRLARRLPAVARTAMGLLFLLAGGFGLAMAVGIASAPPPSSLPAGAADFMTAMMRTGYLFALIKVTETVVGVLLVSNRLVPLALTVIAPVLVNIVAFHAFLEPAGLPVPLVLTALEVYLAWAYRGAFRGVLAADARPEGA